MGKNERSRLWKSAKLTASTCGRWKNTDKANKLRRDKNKTKKIEKEKIKEKKKKMTLPLTANYITKQLNCFPNFIGCIPENELDRLVIGTLYPCYLIVNIDSGTMPGSHWIAIGIFSKSIEVFDSLGFDIFNWPRVPCSLLKFVHRLSVTRELKVSKRLQSDQSNLCGYYCLFYIFMRKHTCMKTLLSYFGSKLLYNDSILKQFFLYI